MKPRVDNRDSVWAEFDALGSATAFRLTTRVHHPSLNEWAWAPHFTRSKVAKEWHALVLHTLHAGGLLARANGELRIHKGKYVTKYARPLFPGKVDASVTYHWPDERWHDFWNYPPKFAVDALVGPVVKGDHAKVFGGGHIYFNVDPSDPRMEIDLQAVS